MLLSGRETNGLVFSGASINLSRYGRLLLPSLLFPTAHQSRVMGM